MKIKFLGENDDNLTGSMTLLEFPNKTQGLIDFGLTQFNDGNIASSMIYNGKEFDFDIDKISFVVITHAHADHMGLLPLLVKRGFKGKIITTVPTAEFANITLYDTVKIFESDCNWYNKNYKNPINPIYDELDVYNTINSMRGYDFNREIHIDDEISLTLRKAGHMLGACMPCFTFIDNKQRKKKILFTGDTSGLTTLHPFIPRADSLGDIDYLVTESTYGDRAREKSTPIEDITQNIHEICIDKRGTLVIPVFSLQRSSEVLWLLREIYYKNHEFYKIPIYVDSPLTVKAQQVMNNNRKFWAKKWVERDSLLGNLFEWNVVQYVENYSHSQQLHNDNPKIILSSSGMCEGGRVIDHLKYFLPNKNNGVLFTGFQVNGTVGHGLLNTTRGSIGINGDRVDIRAKVSKTSMSGHADMNQLTALIQTSTKGKLKKIFITHGNLSAKKHFKQHLQKRMVGVRVFLPKKGKSIKVI